MGTGSFPGVKRPGRGADHPPPPKRRGHERVELYLYSPSGPSWPVMGRTLPLPLPLHFIFKLLGSYMFQHQMCHPQGACFHYLAKLCKYNCSCQPPIQQVTFESEPSENNRNQKHLVSPTYIEEEHRKNNFQVQGLEDSTKINTLEHIRQQIRSHLSIFKYARTY